MESVIVICLLVIVGLLVHDKITFKQSKTTHRNKAIEKRTQAADNIIGKPKSGMKHHQLNNSKDAQLQTVVGKDNSFEIETKIKGFTTSVQNAVQDDFKLMLNFEEEEAEWRDNGEFYEPEGFATGVSFEELNIVGRMLHHEPLENPLHSLAVQIVHKLEGTELLDLLENSMENASQKIAMLLDKGMTDKTKSSFSIVVKDKFDDFNIQDFIER